MSTKTDDIFRTVPSEDFIHMERRGNDKYNRIRDMFHFTNKDISMASGVPLEKVRLDSKMTKALKDRFMEWAILLNHVAGHFDGDLNKTAFWFTTKNPFLGNISPRDMIRTGRSYKLLKFILLTLEENK